MDEINFYSREISLDSKLFQNSELSFHSKRKTIGQSVYNVHEALAEKYFIRKESYMGAKLIGEISHINTDLNLNPLLCYYPIFWQEGKKIYKSGKEIKLEVGNKSKWIEFIIDKKSREFYGGFGLALPAGYFLKKQMKD